MTLFRFDSAKIQSAMGLVAAGALLAGCAGEDNIVSTSDRPSFEEFKTKAYKEPGEHGVYIVDGDIPVYSEDKLRQLYNQIYVEQSLIINLDENDSKTAWNLFDQANLTYCVSNDFGAHKGEIIAAMEEATGAWEAAANVNYEYLPEHDDNCHQLNPSVTFDVGFTDDPNQGFLARAFFPNDPRPFRNVIVHDIAFTAREPLVGVLRHELGHTLGFRHEHIRPEAGTLPSNCSNEVGADGRITWASVNEYDKDSVMHYWFCNGNEANADEMNLSAGDKAGAAAIYGPAGDTVVIPSGVRQGGTQAGELVAGENVQIAVPNLVPGTTFEAGLFKPQTDTEGAVAAMSVVFDGPSAQKFSCDPVVAPIYDSCLIVVPEDAGAADILIEVAKGGQFQLDATWIEQAQN